MISVLTFVGSYVALTTSLILLIGIFLRLWEAVVASTMEKGPSEDGIDQGNLEKVKSDRSLSSPSLGSSPSGSLDCNYYDGDDLDALEDDLNLWAAPSRGSPTKVGEDDLEKFRQETRRLLKAEAQFIQLCQLVEQVDKVGLYDEPGVEADHEVIEGKPVVNLKPIQACMMGAGDPLNLLVQNVIRLQCPADEEGQGEWPERQASSMKVDSWVAGTLMSQKPLHRPWVQSNSPPASGASASGVPEDSTLYERVDSQVQGHHPMPSTPGQGGRGNEHDPKHWASAGTKRPSDSELEDDPDLFDLVLKKASRVDACQVSLKDAQCEGDGRTPQLWPPLQVPAPFLPQENQMLIDEALYPAGLGGSGLEGTMENSISLNTLEKLNHQPWERDQTPAASSHAEPFVRLLERKAPDRRTLRGSRSSSSGEVERSNENEEVERSRSSRRPNKTTGRRSRSESKVTQGIMYHIGPCKGEPLKSRPSCCAIENPSGFLTPDNTSSSEEFDDDRDSGEGTDESESRALYCESSGSGSCGSDRSISREHEEHLGQSSSSKTRTQGQPQVEGPHLHDPDYLVGYGDLEVKPVGTSLHMGLNEGQEVLYHARELEVLAYLHMLSEYQSFIQENMGHGTTSGYPPEETFYWFHHLQLQNLPALKEGPLK